MVLPGSSHGYALRNLRKLGFAAAYAAALISGTALLMAAFSGLDDGRTVGANGTPLTMADVVMQSAAERALVSPRTAVLVENLNLDERRGSVSR